MVRVILLGSFCFWLLGCGKTGDPQPFPPNGGIITQAPPPNGYPNGYPPYNPNGGGFYRPAPGGNGPFTPGVGGGNGFPPYSGPNGGFYQPTGGNGYYAPMPNAPGYGVPNGQGNGVPYFFPQDPSQYVYWNPGTGGQQNGSPFYPFQPIYNYMQANPFLRNYWMEHWNAWLQYARQRSLEIYNFPAFWFEFSPMRWNSAPYWSQVYDYFQRRFYFWMQPNVSLAPRANPTHFWRHYGGYPFGPVLESSPRQR